MGVTESHQMLSLWSHCFNSILWGNINKCDTQNVIIRANIEKDARALKSAWGESVYGAQSGETGPSRGQQGHLPEEHSEASWDKWPLESAKPTGTWGPRRHAVTTQSFWNQGPSGNQPTLVGNGLLFLVLSNRNQGSIEGHFVAN